MADRATERRKLCRFLLSTGLPDRTPGNLIELADFDFTFVLQLMQKSQGNSQVQIGTPGTFLHEAHANIS